MRSDYLKNALRFCVEVGEESSPRPLLQQGEVAIASGATMIRFVGAFSSNPWGDLSALCTLCKSNDVPFIVQDDLLLAKAIGADGVHITQAAATPQECRLVLGPAAVIGKSIDAFDGPSASVWDYLEAASDESVPPAGTFITVGGVTDPAEAKRILSTGVSGITAARLFASEDPEHLLYEMASACGIFRPAKLLRPWEDEFRLISALLEAGPKKQHVSLIVPPGDDAALLASLSRPVITTDTQKEGIHFRLDWQTPEEIGRKAVTVTLSDLAASFARPVSLFVNLSLPAHLSEEFLVRLYHGIGESLARYGCALGGGNISSGREFSLDLMAVGEGREDIFPRRSEAQTGFGLYSTGPLGLARAGLEALLRNDADFPELVTCFKEPKARFDAAEILAKNGVTCVMDISDGLSGDALHIAEAAHVTIELDATALSGNKLLTPFCGKHQLNPEVVALSGGEDYELLFACPPEIFEEIRQALPEALPVGRCLPFQEKHIINPTPGISSYRHGQ